ncbi:hypothetical protein BJP36_38155 [Moorena producens JHB]|uniref:Uncharacterized protein n=1 Tax=Moorena producens (strain JHB) TaxID=1454205 RepID=A0A9Q9UWJ2_MOOP1|nr:hypothetical protein [Moorena producens]WAN69918.1 hypothetical protein BJP36_38155 [Moorena producens JHB]
MRSRSVTKGQSHQLDPTQDLGSSNTCSLFPVPCSLFPTPYSLLPTP